MKNRRNIIESELPPQNPFDIWMKDGKFYKSTNKGWVLIENQMEFTNSKLMSKSTATSGTIGVNKETGRASIYNDVIKQWSPLGGGVTETTWQELKDKRDNGQLIPGSLYRITDYNCTTTQENTQSAGHQFDIVLLALSANKLAEEGWAMEHPTDVYDVTFDDGVTKKCYLYFWQDAYDVEMVNMIDVTTMLGYSCELSSFIINEEQKTALFDDASSLLNDENLTYNYFQNSNLSAWKVWYCLDNDTARFAWADDREGYYISGQSQLGIWDNQLILRAPGWDSDDLYGWEIVGTEVGIWTKTLDINVGQLQIYNSSGELMGVATVSSAIKVYNGRGVIYRLIDEWNNDVPYDFKNIQFKRPISGENTWVYTYTWYDLDKNIAVDTSLDGGMMDGFIGIYNGTDSIYELSNNVIANPSGCSIKLVGTSGYCTISGSSGLLLYNCDSLEIEGVDDAIYVAGKKVLTES